MQRPTGVAIAVVVGLMAVVAPIWLSIQLAWRQSLAAEESVVQHHAADVVRRFDETRDQFSKGIGELKQAKLPPCSLAEIDLMRRIALTSSYVQAFARIEGDRLICTSLGTTSPISLGPPTVITEYGAAGRLSITVPLAGDTPFDIYSKDGYAVFILPSLPLDSPTEDPGLPVAAFVPSAPAHPIVAGSRSGLRPEWFHDIPNGSGAAFVDHGYIVCIARSSKTDIAVIAAAPLSYAAHRVAQFAVLFVPLGLVCGVALAWAVVYVSRRSLSLPSVLRDAAKRSEFFVEYQPVVEMASRRWIGAEALVRWRRPGRVICPNAFIPVAEASGAITDITGCVAAIVAADLPRFVAVDPDFQVSINLSGADLRSPATIPLLEKIVRAEGARPANLEIEATEHSIFQKDEVHDLITEIRSLGISVAIDDFGTGYSSLSRLQDFALETLKIDKAFIDTIGTDGVTSGVIHHIIEMAHALKLELVAEGVETEEQASFLMQHGVRYAQGWLFAMPMPIEAICQSLRQATLARKQEIPV